MNISGARFLEEHYCRLAFCHFALPQFKHMFRLLYLVKQARYRIANKRAVARLTIRNFLFVSSSVKRYVNFILV